LVIPMVIPITKDFYKKNASSEVLTTQGQTN